MEEKNHVSLLNRYSQNYFICSSFSSAWTETYAVLNDVMWYASLLEVIKEKLSWMEGRWIAFFVAWCNGKASKQKLFKETYSEICLIEFHYIHKSQNHAWCDLTDPLWIISDKWISTNHPHSILVESVPPASPAVITRWMEVLQKIWIMSRCQYLIIADFHYRYAAWIWILQAFWVIIKISTLNFTPISLTYKGCNIPTVI